MRYVADIHIHSRFARATSRDLNAVNLHRWSALKGVTVVGTGDFTHPEWLAELKGHLAPAEPGLYRLKDELLRDVEADLYPGCRNDVRFVLSSEISLIYKKDDKTRKVHHVIVMPDFDAVDRLNARLDEIGNLKSDGRPILGLDSRDLVEICLEACEGVLFIPAHIWTPHFAALGASSGFDTLEACFGDMLPHIFTIETGLSSDPPMNWRLSMLDRYAIVSNSDAHSPQKLAREGTCFNTDLSFDGMYEALKTNDPVRLEGTLEFFPEEGKYHLDGHRKCGVRWHPSETLAADGLCPECGKKLTVGVLHRVELLADRPEGERPSKARPFESLVPLKEVIGSAMGVGPTSKRVDAVYRRLLAELGPELEILRSVPVEDIAVCGEPLVAEGVRRMRVREVTAIGGFDGEYGTIQVLSADDRERLSGQAALFGLPDRVAGSQVADRAVRKSYAAGDAGASSSVPGNGTSTHVPQLRLGVADGATDGLDRAQREAVEAQHGPVVVVAGPGTGKTRVLTRRVAHLVLDGGVPPQQVTAVTFTNKAADEMRGRVRSLIPSAGDLAGITIGTFHGLALDLLGVHCPDWNRVVLDEAEAREVLSGAIADADLPGSTRETSRAISLAKAKGIASDALVGSGSGDGDSDIGRAYRAYEDRLRAFGACDYDDILVDLLDALEQDADTLEKARAGCRHLLVDEFQDVNAVQYRIVRLLADKGKGLFVIGDPDQAVYGFRGASPSFFSQLAQDFPEISRVALETSYRSTDVILSAASSLMSAGAGSDARSLSGCRGEGARIRMISVPGETAEGIAVVREISRMVGGADMLQSHGQDGGGGESTARGFGDIGVLFRTGRQAEMLETCFLQEGLPYRVIGQRETLDAASVRSAVAFFRYVVEPDTGIRLLNALGLPGLGLGKRGLESASRALVDGTGDSAWTPSVRKARERLDEMAQRYRRKVETEAPADVIGAWADELDLQDEDLGRFVGSAVTSHSVKACLDRVLMGKDADVERTGGQTSVRQEAVTLMTMHAAKGLEFPVVFICGVEDGLIPFRDRGADLEEERRLFYVGLTRAKDEVVLTRARSRRHFGKRSSPESSPFLGDLPQEALAYEEAGARRRPAADQLSLW